jgi:hypothetical protein
MYFVCIPQKKESVKSLNVRDANIPYEKKPQQKLSKPDIDHHGNHGHMRSKDEVVVKKSSELQQKLHDTKDAQNSSDIKEKMKSMEKATKLNPVESLKSQEVDHNLSFESLASKHKSRLQGIEDNMKTTPLNDSVNYRDRTVAQESSDSEDDLYKDAEDSVPGGATQPYRDTSVVDISSDEDEELYDSGTEEKQSLSSDASEQSDPPTVTSVSGDQKKLTSLLSGIKSKDTQVIQTQRADGTKVIKIINVANKNAAMHHVTSTANQNSASSHVISAANKKEPVVAAAANQILTSHVLNGGSHVDGSKPAAVVTSAAIAGNDLLKHVRKKNDLLRMLNHQKVSVHIITVKVITNTACTNNVGLSFLIMF